ncbi:MAG: hypothetical protein WBV82_10325 [Myxococcaceae bacterium]
MSIHDLQEEPESTLGSKPMHEQTQVPRGDMPEFGASHLRHEEGEETEDGREIRAHDDMEEAGYMPPVRGEGDEM